MNVLVSANTTFTSAKFDRIRSLLGSGAVRGETLVVFYVLEKKKLAIASLFTKQSAWNNKRHFSWYHLARRRPCLTSCFNHRRRLHDRQSTPVTNNRRRQKMAAQPHSDHLRRIDVVINRMLKRSKSVTHGRTFYIEVSVADVWPRLRECKGSSRTRQHNDGQLIINIICGTFANTHKFKKL